eukprot:4874481-Alexandrium_andersonii.AAC.1
MLEVLCPGISYTERMAGFFVRFTDRPSGDAFRKMLDEQLELIEERVRETGKIELLNDAAT